MNYEKHYQLLIERAKDRELDGYVERHHIIPRCMGGTDKEDNFVRLTAREHFIAHQLLVKIYSDNLHLSYALRRMSEYGRYNSKDFDWFRNQYAKSQRRTNVEKYGEEKAAEISAKLSEWGKTLYVKNLILFEKGHIPWNVGIECSAETKQRISENRSGIPAWNKGLESCHKGKSLEEIVGEEKAAEIKAKQREASTGRTHTDETKDKLRAIKGELHAGYGKKRDDEAVDNVSKGLKLYWSKVKSGEIIRDAKPTGKKGTVPPNKGKTGLYHHTEEAKQKISKSVKERRANDCRPEV